MTELNNSISTSCLVLEQTVVQACPDLTPLDVAPPTDLLPPSWMVPSSDLLPPIYVALHHQSVTLTGLLPPWMLPH